MPVVLEPQKRSEAWSVRGCIDFSYTRCRPWATQIPSFIFRINLNIEYWTEYRKTRICNYWLPFLVESRPESQLGRLKIGIFQTKSESLWNWIVFDCGKSEVLYSAFETTWNLLWKSKLIEIGFVENLSETLDYLGTILVIVFLYCAVVSDQLLKSEKETEVSLVYGLLLVTMPTDEARFGPHSWYSFRLTAVHDSSSNKLILS